VFSYKKEGKRPLSVDVKALDTHVSAIGIQGDNTLVLEYNDGTPALTADLSKYDNDHYISSMSLEGQVLSV